MTETGRPSPQTAEIMNECKDIFKTDSKQSHLHGLGSVPMHPSPVHLYMSLQVVSVCHSTADVSLLCLMKRFQGYSDQRVEVQLVVTC